MTILSGIVHNGGQVDLSALLFVEADAYKHRPRGILSASGSVFFVASR